MCSRSLRRSVSLLFAKGLLKSSRYLVSIPSLSLGVCCSIDLESNTRFQVSPGVSVEIRRRVTFAVSSMYVLLEHALSIAAQ